LTTEFLLIRHGETVWNAEARMQGQQDSPLTARGRAQAQAVAAHLRNVPLDRIYASDAPRVVSTAQPLVDLTDHELILEPRLRERRYGIFEGLTYPEIEARHNTLYRAYREQRYAADFEIPGAETIRQLVARGIGIFQKLAEDHPGERLAIFSHGGTLAAILRTVLGVPLDGKHAFRLGNGTISTISWDGEEWRLASLGECTHLQEIS